MSLILDIAILALLMVTLGAGYLFHKRLKAFQSDTKELETLIRALDNAATRAEAALGNLRKIAEDVGTTLSDEANKTQGLLDELNFMTTRADQLADKLEGAISGARKHEKQIAPSEPIKPHQGSSPTKLPLSHEQRRRVPDLEKRLKTLR